MRLALLILIAVNFAAYGQKIPETGINVRITQADKTIVAEIKAVNAEFKINPAATYFWYGSNTIHQTQGGFSARLLNGTYNEYYLNKNLKEQGVFNKGLKTGLWKDWSENGLLLQTVTYSKGIRSGPFLLYDETGKPKQSGKYKNNEFEGPISTFNKDVVSVTLYKNGKAVPNKATHSFWNKLNLFKKQPKTISQSPKKTST